MLRIFRCVSLTMILMICFAHGEANAQEIIWQALSGPWEQTAGPFGGTVRSIAIAAEGTIFAGTENGMFRSTDHGATWQEVNNGLTRPFVSSVLVIKPRHVLAATDGLLFRTTDNGDTWTEIYQASASMTGLALGAGDRVYLSAANGVHCSLDGGATWAYAGLAGKLVMSILARVEDGVEVVYASTHQDGIFRSIDGGTNWQYVGLAGMQIPSLAARADGLLAAGTEYGVYVSNDASQTWRRTPMPKDYLYVYALAFGADGALLAGESGGIYRSTDDGQTWAKHDFVASTVLSIVVNAEGQIFTGTGTLGVFYSTDQGQTWEHSDHGLNNTVITGFALAADGKFYSAVRGAGVFLSTDHGSSWYEFATGLSSPFVRSITAAADGSVYAGVEGLGVYRLENLTNTWTLTNSPRSQFPKALIADAEGVLFLGTAQSVYRSKDRGDSWTRLGNGDLPVVYALAMAADGSMFAGTNEGVYHLAGENATWRPTGLTGVLVHALFYDRQIIYAGGYNAGLYRSLDNGVSWSLVALEGATVSSLTAGPHGDLFAGTFYDGIYASSDGVNWRAYSTGLETDRPILALAFDGSAFLFAGTEGNGIFRSTEPIGKLSTSVVAETPAIPSEYNLAQNYPNPFWCGATSPARSGGNPSTTIKYALARPGHVTLKIFDLAGKEIATLVNETKTAGDYATQWNPSNVPSGVYLYRLQVIDSPRAGAGGSSTGPSAGSGQGLVEVKKLVLLK